MVENTSGAVYTPAASDPDGDPVTVSIAGGEDAASFTISGGALSFVSPRNFDLATDSNRDNVYQVTLQASDGKGGSASLNLAVTVTNSKEGIAVRRVASGLVSVVAMTSGHNGSQMLLGQADRTVTRIDGSTGASVAPTVVGGYPGGVRLLGLVQRPGNTVYDGVFRVLRSTDGSIFVDRNGFTLSLTAAGTGTDANAAIALGRLNDIVVAVGDPGGLLAQDASSGFGKLWRIDNVPDPYAGATARFFQAVQVGKGIRQPGGMSVVGGVFAFSDRGQSRADEVSEFVGGGPVNYGWPFFEGDENLQAGAPAGLLRPIFALPLGTGARESAGLVGPVDYSGAIASLSNHVILADRDGSIWSYSRSAYESVTLVGPDRLEVRTEDFRPDAGSIGAPVAIAKDAQGTVYILDADGELFRVESA